MRKRDYRDFVNDILTSITDIAIFTQGMNYLSFKQDKKTIYAVVRCVEIIEEASQKIPKIVKDKYPAVPWLQLYGMKHKLIHEDLSADIDVLWQILREDVPVLKKYVETITSESSL